MKTTKYLLYALPALMLAACASDEPTGAAGADGAAMVRADIGAVTSRASGTQWGANDRIGISGVSGSVTYDNVPYITADGNGIFAAANGVANGIFFQDNERSTFSAYYPYDPAVSAENPVIEANTKDQRNASAFDFLFASGAQGSFANPTLYFTGTSSFDHSMAKLVINITADNEAGFNGNLVLTEGDIYLSGISLDGKFDTATGVASASWSDATHCLSDNAEMTVNGNSASFSLIYFPQTLGEVKLSIEYEGATYVCSFTPILAAGKRYTANITLKKTGLTVGNATLDGWNDGGSFDGEANYIRQINGHDVVLMRKQSGIKGEPGYLPALYFATCNIGAEKPQDFGLYFWWGDTQGYKAGSGYNFTEANTPTFYLDKQGLIDKGYIGADGNLLPQCDAATVNWGGPWRMPTYEDYDWMEKNCTITITDTPCHGLNIKSNETGAQIFLPGAGILYYTNHLYDNHCNYWTSSCNRSKNPLNGRSHSLWLNKLLESSSPANCIKVNCELQRSYGMQIRPVANL